MEKDLISREAVIQDIEWIKANTGEYNHAELDEYIERIKKIPAVDAEPVQHGNWEERHTNVGTPNTDYFCSQCNFASWHFKYNYCPNCGAKMDAEVEG